MDTDAFKLLLESQERTFRSALDVVTKQFQARISSMEGTISELTKSLEFTQAEVLDLKREADHLKKSNSDSQAKIQDYIMKTNDLEKRFNYQEDYSRRNNLRISGLEEPQNNETWEQTTTRVSELFINKLQLPAMNLERAHRVGPASSSRPRTVVVRFERFGDRETVIRNARKLKGTGVYINEDLCAASQAIKQSQIPLMKQARLQGKVAYFRNTKLIIKDRMNQHSSASNESADAASSGAGGAPAGSGSTDPAAAEGGASTSARAATNYTDCASNSADGGVGPKGTVSPSTPADVAGIQKRDLRKGKKK